MTKKILLSVAASALLTTSAFAGTGNGSVSTYSGHKKITEESYQQNGMDVIPFSSFVYTADLNLLSDSISQPLVKIDITDLEFPRAGTHAATPGDNSAELFDKDGKGVSPISMTNDQRNELEEHFNGTFLVNIDFLNNNSDLEFTNIDVVGTKVYANFEGGADESVISGQSYVLNIGPTIANTPAPVDIDFKYVRDGQKIAVTTFAQSTNVLVDEASQTYTTAFPAQFKVSCVRKFDGLINFENDRTSFVNPEHGDRVEVPLVITAGSAAGVDTISSDTVIDRDRMIFSMFNTRNADATTRYMGGHGTTYKFDTNNNNNIFGAISDTEWSYNLKILTEGTPVDGNDTDTLSPSGPSGTAVPVAFAANTFTITHPLDAPIPTGTTTYQLDLVSLDGTTPIQPVKFTNPRVDLEDALSGNANDEIDTEDTSTDTEVLHGNIAANTLGDITANFIDNTFNGARDNDTGDYATIVPQIASDHNLTAGGAGEWRDHAYIAQIAGATDGTDVKSKVFIVNRSCAPVRPTFKLIREGKVSEYKANAAIAVDSQVVAKLGKIKDQTGYTLVSGPDLKDVNGLYAVEVILPGIAEDFYVYAQALHLTKGQFKDLPVYNTSNRD